MISIIYGELINLKYWFETPNKIKHNHFSNHKFIGNPIYINVKLKM